MTQRRAETSHDAPATAPRGEYLIRGGHILSVDPEIGDIAEGDVHVRDGVITGVAQKIDAPDAEVIDARDCVVMPGFVDVHWHMWNSVLRGMSHDAVQYFGLFHLAQFYTARDHYWAVRYAATEAVNAGLTACHNWAHGLRDFADAEAEMQALADSGLRARFGYGDTPPGLDGSIGEAELKRALAWLDEHGDGRVSLGIAIQNGKALPEEVRVARGLGLQTIAPHTDFSGHLDLVGPDFLYTHGAGAPAEEIAFVAATGMKVGLCPSTDPLVGAGLPPLQEMLAGGVRFENIGFSVDVNCQTAVDPFASMRILLHAARIAQRPETSFSDVVAQDLFGDGPQAPLMHPREVIELATLGGARVLGLDEVTGSLTPGKRADVILVRTDQINMLPAPGNDPSLQLVQNAGPANVDTVIADGRILKQGGRLRHADAAAVSAQAVATQVGIRERGFREASQDARPRT
ncbi:amidohydrolase family protein [Spirillospora sp. CA-255316]